MSFIIQNKILNMMYQMSKQVGVMVKTSLVVVMYQDQILPGCHDEGLCGLHVCSQANSSLVPPYSP